MKCPNALRVLMVGYMYPNLDMEDITINFWSYGHTHQFWNVKCDEIEPFNFGQPSKLLFIKTTNLKKKKIEKRLGQLCKLLYNFHSCRLQEFQNSCFQISWALSFRTVNDRVSRANFHFKLQVTFLPTWAKSTSSVDLAILKSQTD